MIKINNFVGTNSNIKVLEQKGNYQVIGHLQDNSVLPETAKVKYYMSKMNCIPKQVVCSLRGSKMKLKPGAMQMMFGDIQQTTGVTGVGDFLGKMVKSRMTGDAPIKPVYEGSGIVLTEPTYLFPIIEDVSEWGGGLACDDGMFYCCDASVQDSVTMRNNFSSAVAGGEGLFNLCLIGQGYAVLLSRYPREELYEIVLDNDCVKIDGNNAVCWSNDLQFTVERSGKSLIGSAASGEGLVNVYRGTGKILVAPRV